MSRKKTIKQETAADQTDTAAGTATMTAAFR